MSRTDICSRDDIDALLYAFYGRALADDVLAPVFTAGKLDLAVHLPRIGDFWEVTLLHVGSYAGAPIRLHRELVKSAGLRARHFDRWLALWQATVTELYAGPVADRAADHAVRMAAGMVRAIGLDGRAHTPAMLGRPHGRTVAAGLAGR